MLLFLLVNFFPSFVYDSGPLTRVSALLGSRALLPCDATPTEPDDKPILVLFYKGTIGTPVYSLDARGGPLNFGTQWVDGMQFGSRVSYEFDSRVQGLLLRSVQASDHAFYRCRVDFHASPTQNSRIQLDVIIPPRKITITNGAGIKVEEEIGPYNLGATLILSCKVEGGRPRPQVTWLWKNTITDISMEVRQGDLTVNTITIRDLKREDIGTLLTCISSNTNDTKSLKASVLIDMTLPPSDVKILGTTTPIKSGGNLSLTCQARGSKPPAEITWWKDGINVANVVSQVNKAKNETTSSLRLRLVREDDQSQIVCRAKNPFLSSAVVEATRKISVLYRPKLKLVPGPNINMNDIEEGDDVYIECRIKANPPTRVIEWFHEEKKLIHNKSEGIIQSNQSLVLQNVRKKLSGNYVCSASSSQGKTKSNQLFISVKYLPQCKPGQQLVYGAEKNEKINASCGVNANPPPTSYHWAFNSSSEIITLADIKGDRGNRISYVPATDLDFGSLLCWAVNSVGKQRCPCVFHVIHSVIPEPVSNCSVLNLTSISASINCIAGWDGGLEQIFKLRVSHWPGNSTVNTKVALIKDTPRVLAKTLIPPKPHFVLKGLQSGSEYRVSISAINKKGQSQERHVTFKTLGQVAEVKGIPETEALTMNFSSVVAVLSSIGLIFLLICVGIFGILWIKRSSSAKESVKISFSKDLDDASQHYMEFERARESSSIDSTKTPDIIPTSSNKHAEGTTLVHKVPYLSKDKPPRISSTLGCQFEEGLSDTGNKIVDGPTAIVINQKQNFTESPSSDERQYMEILTELKGIHGEDLYIPKQLTSSLSYTLRQIQSPLNYLGSKTRRKSLKSSLLNISAPFVEQDEATPSLSSNFNLTRHQTLPRRKHETKERYPEKVKEGMLLQKDIWTGQSKCLTKLSSTYDGTRDFDRESAV